MRSLVLSKVYNIFGLEIKTPKAWLQDKAKSSLGDMFIEYLTVAPIVIGVSFIVYILVGLISKTAAKICVFGLFIYSVGVFLFG